MSTTPRGMSRKGQLVALLALAASGWSTPTQADRFHYQSVLIGQRAIGLGGAFTGVADDPSASFYNPGGLAQIPKDGISVSLSVSAFDERKTEDGLITSVGTEDLTHKGKPTVPVSATMMLKLGKQDAEHFRSHAVAFSTFTRDRDDFTYKTAVQGQLPDGPTRRRGAEAALRASRSELWYGPSYAYRHSPRWFFGISTFLSVLRVGAESQTTSIEGDVQGSVAATGQPAPNPTFGQQLRDVDVTAHRLLMRAGTLYKPTLKLSLGLMVQTPTLHVASKGSISDRIITIDGPQNVGTFSQVKRKVSAVSPDPWEVRLGVGYRATEWLMLSADGSIYSGTASKSRPQKTISIRQTDNPDDVEPTTGKLFMNSWYRRPTGNVSVGAQIAAGRVFDLSVGFFTDLSSAPAILKTSNTYAEPDVNHLGATWACAFHRNRYNVSVGLLALWGQGDGYSYNQDAAPNEAPYTRSTVTDRTFMLFLYGYTKALERAAQDSYEAVEKRRKKRGRAARTDG